MAKAAFNKNLFASKLDIYVRNKVVKWYIWSIALYDDESWILWKLDQKYVESFEMWCWEKDGEDQLDRSCDK